MGAESSKNADIRVHALHFQVSVINVGFEIENRPLDEPIDHIPSIGRCIDSIQHWNHELGQ